MVINSGQTVDATDYSINGYLVDRNPIEFGKKICLIHQDSTLREKLSKGARQSISSYWNWDMAFERLHLSITVDN